METIGTVEQDWYGKDADGLSSRALVHYPMLVGTTTQLTRYGVVEVGVLTHGDG